MKEFLANLAISTWAVFAPIHTVMAVVFVLIILDFITGLYAANKRREKITSANMRRTLSKLVVYQIAIISGFLVEKYILGPIIPLQQLIAGLISIVELKSLLENVSISTNPHMFKELISRLDSVNASNRQDKEDRDARQDDRDARQDARDVAQEARDIAQDVRNIAQDIQNLKQDAQNLKQDTYNAEKDKKD